TDDVTNETKELRAISGYTTNFAQAGSRTFTIKATTSGLARPVITSAVVSRSGRENNAPVQISYALSDSALVTVRILSASGKEVFTATRGRADGAGQNTVTWLLRDNANRAVAPGTYRVEIIAETSAGDRARRIVPVNVIR
ncbi:MAG: FlgD immunoglobulin-like domain containing protein, partial [Armatimonadota bacterium]